MKTAPYATPGDAGPQTGGDTDASTRHRVARSILEHGPSTAAQLADRLGLTAAGVRRHLDVLLEQGRLTARDQRVYGTRGRGRPAKVFVLSDSGRDTFYSAYDQLAVRALEFLAAEAGPEAVERFAASRVEGLETRYATAVTESGADTTPVQVLADVLSGEGYAASLRPSVAGVQLCQHHCPVAHVAERFPQLCEAETEAFSRLLGVHVQRLATIAHGDGVCTTHIPAAIPAHSPAHTPAHTPVHTPAHLPRTTTEQNPNPEGQQI